jgi:hypothetical protein
MTERIALFQFHHAVDVCRDRVRLLRALNPGLRVFGIFGGDAGDFSAASELAGDALEQLYRFEGRDGRWRWQNTDLVVRAWYAAVGRDVSFDVVHVVQWDLLMFERLDRLYAHVSADAVGLTGLTRLDAIADRWAWTVDAALRADEERLLTIAQVEFGYDGIRHACLGPGYCLPRRFLDGYAALDVPEAGHDETRLPLFAQILGHPLADTGLYPTWFDPAGHLLFNADAEEIDPAAIAAEIRRPDGRRAFHPCRKSLGAGDLDALAALVRSGSP